MERPEGVHVHDAVRVVMWIPVLESIFGNGDAGLEKCWINGVYVNGGGGLGTELPLPLFLGGRGGDFLVRRVGGGVL